MIIKALLIYVIASYMLVPVLFFINEKYNLKFDIFWYCESTTDKFTNFCNCWFVSPFTIIAFILQETINIITGIFEFLSTLVYDTIMNLCNKDE